MNPERKTEPEFKPVNSLGTHVAKVWWDIQKSRPKSFYLLLAIIVVLLLGLQLATLRDNPKQFAIVLSLMFIFFGAVMVFAVLEFGEIVRKHLKDRRELFRTTLGEPEFIAELGRKVSEKRDV